MLRAIVVDDEWYNLEEITDLIEGTGFIQVVEKHLNPRQALQNAEQSKPDLAFLDVEMPEIDGITLAEMLYEACPGIRVVFITSWNQYAVQAFDLNAIDYILKPIKIERFNRMVDKIRCEFEAKKSDFSNKIKINCFSKLETSIGGIPVKWGRSKAEELFAYLVMHHDCYIHKESIVQALWADNEPTKALQILQTVVCRIRNIFSQMSDKIVLEYSASKYCLVLKEVECDLAEMENIISKYQLEDENTYECIEKALLLYKNGFLKQQGYLWSIEKEEELRKKYIQILREIVAKYGTEDKNKEQCKYLKHLATLMPYDNEVNYRLLKTWQDMGEQYSAQQHYNWLCEILKEEYDTVISKEIQDLFQ